MESKYDVLILGGGPGGCTAALYCARAGLRTLVLEKEFCGGQMALTSQIDNYPGFSQGVDGVYLAEQMRLGAERFGAKTLLQEVTDVRLTGRWKTVRTRESEFCAKTVIIATGAAARELGLPEEAGFRGKGISYCAECDGMFYRGKTVAVVGGGNAAVSDALLLRRICKRVYLIHRRDTLRATKIYHNQILDAPNVTPCWNKVVTKLLGDGKLTGVRIQDTKTGTEETLDCDGVFVSIGRRPETDLFQGELPLDEGGYIVADESTETAIPGVYAVGDARTKAVRQIITAAADGAAASHCVQKYLEMLEFLEK